MTNASAVSSGSRIHYSGDMANASGWFVVTAARPDGSVDLREENGDREFRAVRHIGDVYAGHCSPRFVIENAVTKFRAERLAALLAAASS